MRVVPILLSDHAREAIARRGLSEGEVRAVAEAPEQIIEMRPGRVLMQSILHSGGRDPVYLLRVVVDVSADSWDIVTAYKTTRITKYWRGVQ